MHTTDLVYGEEKKEKKDLTCFFILGCLENSSIRELRMAVAETAGGAWDAREALSVIVFRFGSCLSGQNAPECQKVPSAAAISSYRGNFFCGLHIGFVLVTLVSASVHKLTYVRWMTYAA